MGRIVLRLDRMMVERKMSLNELAARVGIAASCEALDCEAGDILEFRRGED